MIKSPQDLKSLTDLVSIVYNCGTCVGGPGACILANISLGLYNLLTMCGLLVDAEACASCICEFASC